MNASKAIKTASSEHILVNVGGGNYAVSHKAPRGWEQGHGTNRMAAVYHRRCEIVRSALCMMGHERDDVENAVHSAQNRGLDTSIPTLMEAAQRRLNSSLPQVKGGRE